MNATPVIVVALYSSLRVHGVATINHSACQAREDEVGARELATGLEVSQEDRIRSTKTRPKGEAGQVMPSPQHHVFNEAAHKLPRSLEADEPESAPSADEASLRAEAESILAGEGDVVAHASRVVLALGALGVVYGDIGTSPLYVEQVTFGFSAARHVTTAGVYGVISLIFWALAIIVSTKYAGFIMRAHNRGDGGIMALAALCRRHKTAHAVTFVTLGIVGASLFFGDGMITPAISVLSAVSGLKVATPGIGHLVVPISVVILIALFLLQRKGTGTVGWLFGPITLIWFLSIAAVGVPEVIAHPAVLQAVSPTWAVRFIIAHTFGAFLMLGGVVLCVTGAEALYADRGHFGPGPIRLGWFGLVWPVVLLSYMGQAAWLIDHPQAPLHPNTFNPFFAVVPGWFQIPEVILATAATVIASQAVISGSYTIARLAGQLGYLPRMRIIHTSEMEGQIYVPVINWILGIGVITLVLVFRSSNGLASAYGLAVTGTFVLNTILFLAVARATWKIPKWSLALLGTVILFVEVSLFLANLAKILAGAWIPLAVAIAASFVMMTWHAGQVIVTRNRQAKEGDLHEFLDHMASIDPPIRRVPGAAIFLNPSGATTPLALRSMVERIDALPLRLLLVSIVDASVPHVDREQRFVVERLGHGVYPVTHLSIRNGYRDTNSVPEALALARKLGYLERSLDLEDASYYISRITIADTAEPVMAEWRKKLFLGMARNAASPIEHFGLPADRTVSMGSEISL